MNNHLRQQNVVSWRLQHQPRRHRCNNNNNSNSSIPTISMFNSNSSKRSLMTAYRKTRRSKLFYANWPIVRWDSAQRQPVFSLSSSHALTHAEQVLIFVSFGAFLLFYASALSRPSSGSKNNNWPMARRTGINCVLWSMNVRMNYVIWSRRMNN